MLCVLTDISSKIYFIGRHLTFWGSSSIWINIFSRGKAFYFRDHLKIIVVLHSGKYGIFTARVHLYTNIHSTSKTLLYASSPIQLDCNVNRLSERSVVIS
jgi:hypothetical protein